MTALTDAVEPSLLHTAADGYLRTDARGVILDANEAATGLLRCPRPFLVGKPLGLLLAEGARPAFYEFLARSTPPGEHRVFETRVGRRGQSERDIIVFVQAALGDGDQASGYQWLLRDITPTRRAEQALRAERELLDGVIAVAQAIILVLDADGRVLRSNAYLREISGYPPEELAGRSWDELLLAPADLPAARRLVREARRAGVGHTGALPLAARTGRTREVIWSARGLPEGLAGAVVLLGHDVTELQSAQRQALQAERLATIGQVTTGLAHESRNALQRIQACLSLLALRLQDQPEVRDLVNRAQKAQDDLHHLFDDVMGYAANTHLTRSLCDVAAVSREAWNNLATEPVRGELHEGIEAEETNLTCEVDAFQLRRVFRNLFENSLAAATPPVQIEVRCRPTSLEQRPALEIGIHDNGPGFPPDRIHKLFEPFFTTKTHGTGLGLAICRRIIEAHGGRIEAVQDGPGATIRLTVPRRIQ